MTEVERNLFSFHRNLFLTAQIFRVQLDIPLGHCIEHCLHLGILHEGIGRGGKFRFGYRTGLGRAGPYRVVIHQADVKPYFREQFRQRKCVPHDNVFSVIIQDIDQSGGLLAGAFILFQSDKVARPGGVNINDAVSHAGFVQLRLRGNDESVVDLLSVFNVRIDGQGQILEIPRHLDPGQYLGFIRRRIGAATAQVRDDCYT